VDVSPSDDTLTLSAGEVVPKTLGQWIGELRSQRRKRVPSRGHGAGDAFKPWARADLAHEAGLSEATLLRIEADRELPKQDALEAIIRALGLLPWQERLLRNYWIGRALPSPPRGTSTVARDLAERFLAETSYPALVLDQLFYRKAWNAQEAAISGIQPDDGDGAPHWLLEVLTTDFERRWGPQWREYAAARLRHFLIATARYSADPRYPELLSQLEATPGLQRLWRVAIHSDDTTAGKPGYRVGFRHAELGDLEFFVLSSTVALDQTYTFCVYVPAGSSDELYRQFKLPEDAPLYFCAEWRRSPPAESNNSLRWARR